MLQRKPTKKIKVRHLEIGGNAPISVQTMTNTLTTDVASTLDQIKKVQAVGCDIVRISVPDLDSAVAFGKIRALTDMPLVADIHFDYRLAIKVAELGADCLRINPGNIGSPSRIREVVDSANYHNIPIRIGVNAGSLEKDILEKYGEPSVEALLESAKKNIGLLEEQNFQNYKTSIKSSDVRTMIDCYTRLSDFTDNPIHLGLTEAGTRNLGGVKSSLAIGHLLYMGIGDTIRVSLSDDPVEEVKLGLNILKSLGLNNKGLNLISCPGCARQNFDMTRISSAFEREFENHQDPLKISVIGCIVNGIGEAREADIGLVGGDGGHMLYIKGEKYKKLPALSENELVKEVKKLV